MFGKLNVKVGADLSELRKKMGKVGGIVKGNADKMKSVGTSMTKGVTVPLAAMGAAAVKAQMDFESAFTGVQKTVEGTPEQMDALRDGIRGMSREIPVAATRIAGVAEAAGQLGIKTPAIMEFSRTMVDLGEASNLGPDEAATSLARLANVTGMPQTEFDRLGSTVVALGNNLATTESEITEMGQRLAGAGSQVGLAESEILGLAGTLSSVGIRAEAGGSSFSKLLLNIQSAVQTGSSELDAFASTAGMSAGQFAEAFERDAAGALTQFVSGLGRVQAEGGNVSAIFDQIGVQSVRSRDALLRTAGAGDLLAESLALGAKGWAENSALSEEAAKRYSTLSSQFKILWNRIVDVGVEIGGVLAPLVADLIGGLEPLLSLVENLARGFGNLPGPIQKVAVGFGVALAAAGPLLVALGSLPAIASAVATGFGILSGTILPAVATAFTTTWAAATGPVGAVVAAVAAVGASAYAIYQNWESVSGFFSNLWSSVLDVVKGFAKAHLGVLKGLWPAAKTVFLKGIETLIGPLKSFAEWLGADSLAGSISGFQDQLDGLVPRGQLAEARAVVEEGVAQMGRGLSSGASEIYRAGSDLVGAAGDVAARIKNKIAGAFTTPDAGGVMEGAAGGGGSPTGQPPGGGDGAPTQPGGGGGARAGNAAPDLSAIQPAQMEGATQGIKKMAVSSEQFSGQVARNWEEMARRTGISVERLKTMTPQAVESMVSTRRRMGQAAQQISNVVTNGFKDAAAGMLAGIGKMAAGQKSLGGVVKGVLTTLADMAIRVGKIAIATGIAVEGIKKALQSLNPVVAVAAGAALIALGSAVKGALSSAASGGGGGGVTRAGGISTDVNANDDDDRGVRERRDPVQVEIGVRPQVMASGDAVYQKEEGTRRQENYGTDLE